uniref:Gamma-glutamyltransferase n=1 Tax=Strigamia maritima TaxID=126957 RepID=T1IJ67_STRMM
MSSVTAVSWQYLYKMKSLPMPRIRHHLFPNEILAEKSFSTRILDALKSYGHKVIRQNFNGHVYSHVNALGRTAKGKWMAVSEPRLGSGVAGF